MPSTALLATKFWVVLLAVIGLPRATLVGEPPPVPAPVPASGTGRGEPLVLTVSVALRAPAAAGVKVALTVQVAPAARLVPQVVVCANSVEPVVTPERVTAAAPGFRTVTGWAALVVPTFCVAKVRLVGVAVSGGGGGGATVPGQTSSSEIWPAGQPLLAVIWMRTYRATTAVKSTVTVLLATAGSKAPGEVARLVKVVLSVLVSTENGWLRAAQTVWGGSFRITRPTGMAVPRSTVRLW